ncbi:jg9298 [Pararge aegeria aegeria]|uniref:Jg9298 protein n=1 Tax=Pararge aegeria aegeria TaxID=348720 RepID=A0A8S4SGE6_9NEOP|nr:jg9298 [Pararge aegeria aegeria]
MFSDSVATSVLRNKASCVQKAVSLIWPFPYLVGLGPSVVRMATDAAPRWITPASRARSRSLAGRPGRRVLHGVLLRSQGVLRVVLPDI